MSDKKLVAEAKSILDGIKTHQNTANEKFSQFEKQLDDLKRAQRLIQEAQATQPQEKNTPTRLSFCLKTL